MLVQEAQAWAQAQVVVAQVPQDLTLVKQESQHCYLASEEEQERLS